MNTQELQEKWTSEQQKYIKFLAAKKQDQTGKRWTEGQFAELLGVNPATLWRWKKLPGFNGAVLDEKLNRVIDYVPDMVDAQVIKAIKMKDTAAFKEVMRSLELLKAEKQDVKQTGEMTMNINTISYANVDDPA